MSEDIYNKGVVYDSTLPTAVANEEWKGMRVNRYGEQGTEMKGDWRYSRAREATYFIARNPTIDASTTLAGHPAPVLADADVTLTKPLIHLMMPAGSTKFAELDYIEIDVITAGANGTSSEWTDQLDTGASRVTTAGTSFLRLSPNMQSTVQPTLAVQGGVVVVGAESSQCRVIGNGLIRAAIEVAGDRLTFKYGSDPSPGANVVAAAASRHIITRPPVILGATDQYLLALYAPSQSAASVYRIRMAWSER